MKIAYFVSGGAMGFLPLRLLAEHYQIVAVIRPKPKPAISRRWARTLRRLQKWYIVDDIDHFIRRRNIPCLNARSGHDSLVVSQLTALEPDLICIATFPWLLAKDIFTLPACGSINLHPSLLPRHRGPTPLFWLYYHDDRQTGVTVHRVNDRADAGDILLQEVFDMPRGLNIVRLHADKAQRGATLMMRAVQAIAAGRTQGTSQDENLATPAPRVRRGRPMVNFAGWQVERVWHFLAGLYPQYQEPLTDRSGRVIRYRQVLGYAAVRHDRPLGSLENTPYGWDLYCLDGVVRLSKRLSR